jgi:hypothetical protein
VLSVPLAAVQSGPAGKIDAVERPLLEPVTTIEYADSGQRVADSR